MKTALLFSQGAEDEETFANVLERWKFWFDQYKFENMGMIGPNLATAGEAADRPDLDEKITAVA